MNSIYEILKNFGRKKKIEIEDSILTNPSEENNIKDGTQNGENINTTK